MYKEVIISIVIIIGIFILNSITQNYTEESLEIMSEMFNEIKEEIKNDNPNKEELSKKSDEILKKWQTRSEELAYYIEHDELEKVDTYLVALKSNIEREDYNKAAENLEICEYVLDHIDDKEAFLLKNIF